MAAALVVEYSAWNTLAVGQASPKAKSRIALAKTQMFHVEHLAHGTTTPHNPAGVFHVEHFVESLR